MIIKTFNENSQNYLGRFFSESSFNLEDREKFGTITDPYKLNDTEYQIYPFRALTGYLPDPEKEDEPILYTFFVLKAPNEVKERFLQEVSKKENGQPFQEEVISSYYTNFVPSFKPFEELTFNLGRMLEEVFFPGRGYKFVFHMSTVTKDFDIALIYIQYNSVEALELKYPGEIELPFKI